MNKVFFGKANIARVILDKSYRHENKEWFNGIDVGDYIFVKHEGESAKFSKKTKAVVNYLWRAKSWGKTPEGEHELFFEEVLHMHNQLPLGKFVALDMFVLNKNLLNSTHKTVPGCIYPLGVLPEREAVVESAENWEAYYSTNPVRNITFLSKLSEVDPTSRNIQLVMEKDTATLSPAAFIPDEMEDAFIPDALSKSAPKKGSASYSLYKLYHEGNKTIQWDDFSFVGFYDLFFTGQEAAKQSKNLHNDFVEYCKENGVSKSASSYKSMLKKMEKALDTNADKAFEKDGCADMLARIGDVEALDKSDAVSVLKKFIDFKKSLLTDPLPTAPATEEPAPICYKEQKYSPILLTSKNIIFRGAPGTGKSYLAKAIAADIVSNGKENVYKNLSPEQKEQIGFVQFHPSYDYSDFVEGLRPVEKPGNSLGFQLQDGIFKRFVDMAAENERRSAAEPGVELKKYVFIIDEINRGEISKIFGELFFSIDPGYRGEEGAVFTQYANLHADPTKRFYIPKNVYIIGTMNDIDRSVDTFDFAMRRRFRFVEIKADENVSMLDCLGARKAEAIARMKALNEEIVKVPDLNENYQIGAAYFKKLEDSKLTFDLLWTDYLQPLLQEYINGMYEAPAIMKDFKNAYGYGKEEAATPAESEMEVTHAD